MRETRSRVADSVDPDGGPFVLALALVALVFAWGAACGALVVWLW